VLVHRLDHDTSRHAETASGLSWQENVGVAHDTPPWSKPSLPCSSRMTVASSS
jgi:hypothetical protein